MKMNKQMYLKKAKTFLKMAELDLSVIKIVRMIKLILTAALFVNGFAFAAMLAFGMKKR